MRRPAAHGRARVEQDGGFAARGNNRGERGTIDGGQHAEGGVAGHHGRTGVARAEKRLGRSIAHGVGGDANRRARLAPERVRRALGHLDPLGRVGNLDVEAARRGMPSELRGDEAGVAGQQQSDLQMARRDERAVDHDRRPPIAAHGVDRNP
jgi:hypothetical protein